MAGGLFSRVKVWNLLETVFNQDLNGEFNNIINNAYAAKLGGASDNVTQLLATFDPGSVGTENLPQSIAEEIQSLRYQIRAILGSDEWIDSPATTLSGAESALDSAGLLKPNRIISGVLDANGQPQWLRAEGSSAKINLLATATNLETFINGSQVSFSSDLDFSGLSLAPSVNNTALVDDGSITGAENTKLLGERKTTIPIGTIGSEISALNGKLAAFKIDNTVDIEYFIAEVDTVNNVLKNGFRGYFFDDLGLNVPRITINDTNVITLMRISWVFATNSGGTPALDVTFNQPFVQPDQPTSPGSGDYWFDLTTDQWKKFTGASFEVAEAIFVGVCIQDEINCVASRSTDLTKGFNELNTIELEAVTSNQVRSKFQDTMVSVYGDVFRFEKSHVTWSMPGDLDSGEIESINTDYYLYLTQSGGTILSTIPPHNRQFGLLGEYHPSKPYRSIGKITNDGSLDFDPDTLKFGDNLPKLISTSEIDDAAITTAKLADNSVTTEKIINDAVTPDKLDETGNYVVNSLQAVANVQIGSVVLTDPGGTVFKSSSNEFRWGTAEHSFVSTGSAARLEKGGVAEGTLVVASRETGSIALRMIRGGAHMTTNTVLFGEQFSVTKIGAGHARIDFSSAFNDTPSVVVSPVSTARDVDATVRVIGAGSFEYFTHNNAATPVDEDISFIAIGRYEG